MDQINLTYGRTDKGICRSRFAPKNFAFMNPFGFLPVDNLETRWDHLDQVNQVEGYTVKLEEKRYMEG